jgi:transcription-repair coupling factor (superfamily II helicase)
LPAQAQAPLETHRLRIAAKPLGIARINAGEAKIQIGSIPTPPIEPIRILDLIQKNRHYKLAGPDKLIVTVTTASLDERAGAVRDALKKLGARSGATADPCLLRKPHEQAFSRHATPGAPFHGPPGIAMPESQ